MAKRITLTFEGKKYRLVVPDEVMSLPDAQRSKYLEDFLLAQSASQGADIGVGLSKAWDQATEPLARIPEPVIVKVFTYRVSFKPNLPFWGSNPSILSCLAGSFVYTYNIFGVKCI